jgi:hypothetical protein
MKNIRQILFLACVLAASLLSATTSSASNDTHAADTEFKPGEMIQHHITDLLLMVITILFLFQ